MFGHTRFVHSRQSIVHRTKFVYRPWSMVYGLFFCVVYGLPVAVAEGPQATAARTAKVAGAFYPADPNELRQAVTHLLADAPSPQPASPRLLIVPHAGYEYAGPVAARAFREVQGRSYDGVVVVGVTHRDNFEGTSVDDAIAYVTPLGSIAVHQEAVAFLKSQPGLGHVASAHESDEHSLEVMLPFLQVALGEFKLVPLLMGRQAASDAQALGQALAALSRQGNYLYIFSTDLSHYHPYEEAVRRDQTTVNLILGETPQAVARLFETDKLEACGRGPIVASLWTAKQLGYLRPQLLRYANSGDTTVDKGRVVGYASIGFSDGDGQPLSGAISREAGQALVKAARTTLTTHLRTPEIKPVLGLEALPELAQARGMFVTLRKRGRLRGCIGRLEAQEPMATLLPTVALDAALRDSRFAPLTTPELSDVSVEVSVLTPLRRIEHPTEIVAGRDGVVLEQDGHSGVFLPQVWDDTGWTRVEFLRELASQKAGLPPDAWQSAQLFVFQDQVFQENEE